MSNYYTVHSYVHAHGWPFIPPTYIVVQNSTSDLNCGGLVLSHIPILYSSRMKGHACQLRTLQATALFQSTLQSHLIFFGKLESKIPCCLTLHGGYFHVPWYSIIHKKAQLKPIKVPKYQTYVWIDMQFIKFVAGLEENCS